MPSLWKHVSHPIWFNLCINNYGVKYIGNKNLKHLFSALCTEPYNIVEDWAGDLYCSINLKWNYGKHWVDIAMPVYAIKNLTRHNHLPPVKTKNCLYTPNPITYGKDNQATTPSDPSSLLDMAGKKCIQKNVGSFLYYARAVNPTILMALSAIVAAKQSAPTEETLTSVNQFLNYMWTHPDAKFRYRASDVILNIHSDASYLSAPKVQSHAGVYFFLGSISQDTEPIFINGAIHFTCTILKLVVALAAEAKLGALFLNTQKAKVIQFVLNELGHPQPSTPIYIENTTTVGIVNNVIKRQWSQAMESYLW
jgi:hypothetical protein